MNIYTFDTFTNHCIAVEEIDETDRIKVHLQYLEIGPLYLPKPSHLKIVKEAIWNISLLSIPSNWWTGFSSLKDFFGLMRTGTKHPIHSVVLEVNRSLERVKHGICIKDHASENDDISIDLHKDVQLQII